MQLGLCLEQTLGHRAHASNLAQALGSAGTGVDIVHIDFSESGRIPWAFRASWQAARKLRARPKHDVRLFHTQSVSLFAPLIASGRPYVVSVDATPVQVDAMGQWYAHSSGPGAVERLKSRWYRAVFARAAAVVAWSNWAAESLVTDYGVDRERITVLHPGAPREFFEVRRERRDGPPTILFVGGNLPRKGGDLLLEAMREVGPRARLLLVTPDTVERVSNVEVVSGATPGSPALLDAYRRADIFCLPTRGDCTPVVLGEAMAAGLPVITTTVGSNAETVRDGVDGVLLPDGELGTLVATLSSMIENPGRREEMGRNARQRATDLFDAEKNAFAILATLQAVAR